METKEMKHSRLGITSFVISLVIGIVMGILIIIAGIMEATLPGGIDENSVGAIVLGLFLLGGLFVDLVALGLGIAGLFQKERKKIFAILGIIFSGITVSGTLLLMVIGTVAQ